MITYHRTSILTSRAQTVVNTVNTVGVMGKGLAAAYRARYPEMFVRYRELCQSGMLDVGKLWLWKGPDRWVLNFPTKTQWRRPSNLEYIDVGLAKFVQQYEARGITEIAFPRLGCGNGGLDWNDVRPLMERHLAPLPIPVFIHDFEKDIGRPEHKGEHDDGTMFSTLEHDAGWTFPLFCRGIEALVESHSGSFRTIKHGKNFCADLTSNKDIHLRRNGHGTTIPDNDLYQIWDMLLKGPVTKNELAGTARPSAYLLFSFLSTMPQIRPVRVADRRGSETLAIELTGNRLSGRADAWDVGG